jgi:hypothetical protein
MRAATDATVTIDFLAIAFSSPSALLNMGKPDSFLRNESSRSGLNLGSVTKFASCRGITDFPHPSHCPAGNSLISLRDAGTYITKLPKAERDTPACKRPIIEGRLNLHSST